MAKKAKKRVPAPIKVTAPTTTASAYGANLARSVAASMTPSRTARKKTDR